MLPSNGPNQGNLPPVNYKKMISNSKLDRATGNISGGYSAGANHPQPPSKGKRRNRVRG